MAQSRKLSIGIVSCSVPPSCTGQAIVLKRLMLENEDLDCFIFSENLEGGAKELPQHYSLDAGASAVYKAATDSHKGGDLRFLRLYLREMWKRADQIVHGAKTNGLSLLVGCTGDPLDISATMVASFRTGTPFFVYLFDDAMYQWPSSRLRKLSGYIECLWAKLATGVICPNQSLADGYQKRHNLKVHVFVNPSSGSRNARQTANANVKKSIEPTNEKIRIVYTGSVYHAQADAMQNLVTALTDLKGKAEFHVYSPQSPDSKQRYGIDSKLVIWHGLVSEEETLKAQSAADILFLPLAFDSTIQETLMTALPGKTGEYLSSGTPILVHAPEGSLLSTTFQESKAALVVDKPEAGLLKSAIEKIISDDGFRESLVENAMRESKKFDPVLGKIELTKYLRSKIGSVVQSVH
jgi:glycosyltransferase involved in cell wall biosynthesis